MPSTPLYPSRETEPPITSEFIPIFQSLEQCLNLRDKYMNRSGQKLGFNPRDHDGVFTGLDEDIAGVSGVHPDADYASRPPPESPFQKWRIYPRPPPPHWHWKGKETVVPSSHEYDSSEDDDFEFAACEIPGAHEWQFAIDERGVYQVYKSAEGSYSRIAIVKFAGANRTSDKGKIPVFDIPTIREYFVDLEKGLNVIADGPTKSFAFRRLNYLGSKFTMYSLLNESQELAEMKQVPHRYKLLTLLCPGRRCLIPCTVTSTTSVRSTPTSTIRAV